MSTPHRRHWPQYLLALTVLIVLGAASTSFAVLNEFRCQLKGTCGGEDPIAGPDAPAPTLRHIGGLEPVQAGDPQTILLIGSDHRTAKSADGDTGARSDTMMLVRLNGDRPTTLLSIPRDTQVTYNGRIEKINEAFGEGGPSASVQAVKSLLGIAITHVAVIDFEAFQRAVNKLGCLYQDVDRSYFNDHTGIGGYAAINIKSGYQLMCGGDSLSWVRFRHTDSDLVRGSRQQVFLRAAKNQVAASKLLNDRNDLIKIFRHYTQVDIKDTSALLSLLKLMVDSAGQPMRSVKFLANDSPDPTVNTNLLTTPAGIAKMRAQFLHPVIPKAEPSKPKAKKKTTKKGKRTSASQSLAPGLMKVSETGNQNLATASFNLAGSGLPLYTLGARYAQGGWADLDPVRTYRIKASRFGKKSYPAFRLTWSAGGGNMLGQYYGLQGTTWKGAPILQGVHHAVQRRGRTLQVYLAGTRAQLVAWETPHAVYWVSNTLSLGLTTRQLVDMASSMQRVAG